MSRAISAVAVVLLVSACGSSGGSKGPEKAGEGAIAVNLYGDREGGIYLRHPDGSLRRLTKNQRDDFPTWSRDGKQIAFERPFSKQGASHLYVMNADGSDVRQVSGAVTDSAAFDWGADDEIVFGDGKGISVIKSDGTGLKHLVDEGSEPAWSPDGRTIVFRRPPGLFAMTAEGTGVHAFVEPTSAKGQHIYTVAGAGWSRDGKHVAFLQTDILALGTTKPPTTLETVSADGTGRRTLTKVTFSPSDPVHPTWSPDGRSIAYADRHGDAYGIWVIPSAGGKPSRLLEGLYSMPSWGPAGT